MRRTNRALLALVCWSWASVAVGQSKLGELLDAGGKLMSAEEFRAQLVQRVIVGPTLSGGKLELIYANNGEIQGTGTGPGSPTPNPVSGEWKIVDSGKVCSSIRLGGTNNVALPSRCQSWFRYKDQYFLSDSDTDRQARVLVRTVKQ